MLSDTTINKFIEAACPPKNHRDGDLTAANAIRSEHPDVTTANMYAAAVSGEVEALESFLEAQPSLATRRGGPREWDPLLYLAFSRYLRIEKKKRDRFHRAARLLLEHGADPNAHWTEPGEDFGRRESAVYGACGVANDAVLTRMLLEAGADPNDGESPYHAVEFDDLDCAALLFEHGLNADGRATALLRRLDYDDLEGIRRLLKLGADPNHPSHFQKTALHQALERSRALPFFELLLRRGADPNATNGAGKSAYALAARVGREDVLALFAQRDASFVLEPVDAFIAACARGDGDGVRDVLAHEPGLRSRLTEDDRRVIVYAAADGNTHGVRTMLDHGFEIDVKGVWGGSAVHHAAWNGRLDTVRLLADRGANLELKNDYGGTALDAAVWAVNHSGLKDVDHVPVIECLLEAGADVNAVSPFPTGNAQVDELLERHGRKG